MAILAFDTSMRSISVAVAAGESVVARLERAGSTPGEALLPMIQATMAEAGIGFADVTRVATTVGPGGFTGIRVGLAMARGLVLATGAELVGCGSLEVMGVVYAAQNTATGTNVIIAADAGRGGVYAQTFAIRNGASSLAPPRLVTTAVEARDLPDAGGAGLAGPGALRLAELLGRTGTSAPDLQPEAGALAVLARRLTPDPHLRPLYLRSADALPSRGALSLLGSATAPERP